MSLCLQWVIPIDYFGSLLPREREDSIYKHAISGHFLPQKNIRQISKLRSMRAACSVALHHAVIS
jgi:hypothetical protein